MIQTKQSKEPLERRRTDTKFSRSDFKWMIEVILQRRLAQEDFPRRNYAAIDYLQPSVDLLVDLFVPITACHFSFGLLKIQRIGCSLIMGRLNTFVFLAFLENFIIF